MAPFGVTIRLSPAAMSGPLDSAGIVARMEFPSELMATLSKETLSRLLDGRSLYLHAEPDQAVDGTRWWVNSESSARCEGAPFRSIAAVWNWYRADVLLHLDDDVFGRALAALHLSSGSLDRGAIERWADGDDVELPPCALAGMRGRMSGHSRLPSGWVDRYARLEEAGKRYMDCRAWLKCLIDQQAGARLSREIPVASHETRIRPRL